MEEMIASLILQALYEALENAIEEGIKYAIKKTIDETGRYVTHIVRSVDTDNDGDTDYDVVLYTLDITIPDLDSSYCIVNEGDEIGIGMPQYKIIDGTTLPNYTDVSYYPTDVTGNGDGYFFDMDNDGSMDDVIIALPDFTGDGVHEWGWVIDDDNNGVPDASPDAPFYPVGSEGYMSLIESQKPDPSLVIMSGDGTMTVYDTNGNVTAEDCDTAYSLWVSENGIMKKEVNNYSVTEGLLLLSLLVGVFYFVKSLFKKKDIYR